MSAELGSLVVALSADLARFESDLGRANHIAEKNARDIERAFQGVKDLFKGMAVAEFAREMVNATKEAEQASLRLDAVLKATGHAAGIAKDELDGMADALAQSTQFDDESIRQAEATYLKFGNIVGDTFREGIKLAADYAAFTGQSIPHAAQVIGRALSAPAEAAGALEREIGKLAPAQREMIKNFMEAGRVADAQAVVLDALRSKIGGTAEIMNTGLGRATGDVSKAWGEFLETVGKSPVVIYPVLGVLKTVSGTLEGIKGFLDALSFENFEKMARLDFSAKTATTDPKLAAEARAKQDAEQLAAWDRNYLALQAKLQAQADKLTLEAAKKLADERKALEDRAVRSNEAAMAARYEAANDAYIAEGQRGKKRVDELIKLEESIIVADEAAWKAYYDGQAAEQKMAVDLQRAEVLRGQREQEAAFARTLERHRKSLNEMSEYQRQAARNMQDSMATYFYDRLENRNASFGDSFRQMLNRMTADLAASKVMAMLTGDFGKTGQLGGLVGMGVDKLLGASGAAANDSAQFGTAAPGLLESLFSSATPRASGGPVEPNTPYLVGENGPEIRTFDSAGSIVPNGALGGTTISQTIHVGGNVTQADVPMIIEAARRGAIQGVAEARLRGGAFANVFGG